jgi:hypothetical protein
MENLQKDMLSNYCVDPPTSAADKGLNRRNISAFSVWIWWVQSGFLMLLHDEFIPSSNGQYDAIGGADFFCKSTYTTSVTDCSGGYSAALLPLYTNKYDITAVQCGGYRQRGCLHECIKISLQSPSHHLLTFIQKVHENRQSSSYWQQKGRLHPRNKYQCQLCSE